MNYITLAASSPLISIAETTHKVAKSDVEVFWKNGHYMNYFTPAASSPSLSIAETTNRACYE